jgi:hypothetical protein
MLNKIKKFIQKLKCNHDMALKRWHWVHFPNYEPLSVEAEYECSICGKIDYIHLYGKEAEEWQAAMGNYKKVY